MIPSGQRFGRLVVGAIVSRDKHGQPSYRCACDCGCDSVVHSSNLRSGATKSCGCFAKEAASARALKHGHSQRCGKKASSMYVIWSGMLKRCENTNSEAYKWYGARGISVCERWHTFENFLADMGPRPLGPTKFSVDRIDNDGNYEPANCRWATKKEQYANQRHPKQKRGAHGFYISA